MSAHEPQLGLLDEPSAGRKPSRHLARRDNPKTSKEAADRAANEGWGTTHVEIVERVLSHSGRALTFHEIAERTGGEARLERDQVNRALVRCLPNADGSARPGSPIRFRRVSARECECRRCKRPNRMTTYTVAGRLPDMTR